MARSTGGDGVAIVDFVSRLPKAELHLHLEGTLEPELMLKLAARNRVPMPYANVQEARAARQFTNLQSFLDLYAAGCSVLVTKEDFYELTWEYLLRAHSQGVLHTEVMFDPQNHTSRGVAFDTVFQGIHKALKQGEAQLGITFKIIVSILRHLSAEAAMEVIGQALPYKEHITAVGLDSSELGHPPSKFETVFQRAVAEGFLTVAHAGEEGPPAYIWDALQLLQVKRVDHGIKCLEDPVLVQHLRKKQIPLTLCPLSNLSLKVYEGVLQTKLRSLLEHELLLTINSDDPAYFGGYIVDNYCWLSDVGNFSIEQICRFASNSFLASFISQEDKQQFCEKINSYMAAYKRQDKHPYDIKAIQEGIKATA